LSGLPPRNIASAGGAKGGVRQSFPIALSKFASQIFKRTAVKQPSFFVSRRRPFKNEFLSGLPPRNIASAGGAKGGVRQSFPIARVRLIHEISHKSFMLFFRRAFLVSVEFLRHGGDAKFVFWILIFDRVFAAQKVGINNFSKKSEANKCEKCTTQNRQNVVH